MSTSQNILIVGDWFVDEYWFMVRHHSDVSSHTGPVHYRIVSQPDDFVRDLCGCGFIARVFYELRKYKIDNKKVNEIECVVNKLKEINDRIKNTQKQKDGINKDSVNTFNKSFKDYENLLDRLGKEPEGADKSQGKILIFNDGYNLEDWNLINNVINDAIQAIGKVESNVSMKKIGDIEDAEDIGEKINGKDRNLLINNIINAIKGIEGLNKKLAEIEVKIKASLDPNSSVNSKEKEYKIYGIGLWSPNDDDYIPHLIHAHCHKDGTIGRARFSLKPNLCGKKVDILLHNLEKVKEEKKAGEADEDSEGKNFAHGTTRCIRAYRFVKGKFEPLHRIDWELAPKINSEKNSGPKAVKWNYDFFENKTPAPDDNGLKITREVDIVLIDDHKKGVINKELVEKIKKGIRIRSNNFPTRWFVRTKDKNIRESATSKWPDWLREIKDIELLVVGPEIACRSYPIDGLLTEHGELAQYAYELIKSLKKKKDDVEIKNIILTSDKLEVVALFGNLCFIAKPLEVIKNIDLEKINWTTAFFAALAYEMRELKWGNDWQNNKVECKNMMNRAMSNAHRLSGVSLPEVLRETNCQVIRPEPKFKLIEPIDWDAIETGWETAKSIDKLLFGDDRINRSLDMWRLSTDLPGYIMCIKEKRRAIQRIWQAINAFVQSGDSSQSVSILLEADPAAGKSFLVDKLKENIPNCHLVKRDITQMIDRSELLDLFDSVADAQARSKGPVLVFVDEINATLGGSPVYGAFLSPLEGGSYMRNVQQVELKPCIWIFAGTPEHTDGTGGRSHKEKREDFESRMTMIQKIDYKSLQDERGRVGERDGHVLDEEAKLEQVYLGAKRINDFFNDVTQIDIDVLKAFWSLSPETVPARKIGRLAASLRNVQYGRVHKGNCISLEWHELIDSKIMDSDRKKAWRESDLLKVEYVRLKLRPD
jgi:hypothetical protein